MALLMFYSFRNLGDIFSNGSTGEKINNKRVLWGKNEKTTFLEPGFQILQNIDDQLTMSTEVKRARDPVALKNTCKHKTAS